MSGTLFRDVFGTSVRITPPGEKYVGKDNIERESLPGVVVATARGEVRLSGLSLVALMHLVSHDEAVTVALRQICDFERGDTQKLIDQYL